MADFFTRLAARTLGAVPVAQPIIAPIFAQGHAMPGAAIESEAMSIESTSEILADSSRSTPVSQPPVVHSQRSRPSLTVQQAARRSHHAQIVPAYDTGPASLEQTEPEPVRVLQGSLVPTLAIEKPSNKSPIGKNTHEESAIQKNIAHKVVAIDSPAKEIATTASIVVRGGVRPVLSVVEESIVGEQGDKTDIATPHTEPASLSTVQEEEIFVAPGRRTIMPGEVYLRDASVLPEQFRDHPAQTEQSSQLPEQSLLVPQARHMPGVTHQQPGEAVPVQVYSAGSARKQAQIAHSPKLDDKLPADQQPPEMITGASTSTPTIRVTIGRVDVRAVTPPAPASNPRQARYGPTLSLEDYTRRRKEGER